MKKYIYPPAFAITTLILCGLIASHLISQNKNKNTSINDCKDLTSSQLDSERAQAILIKDRKLLAIRLSGETNYSVPGGHIELGESPQQAIHRELLEEAGIKSNPQSYKYYKTTCQPKSSKQQRIYYYLVGHWEDNIKLNTNDKIKWVDSSYDSKKKADEDLKSAIYYLKQDNLID